MIKGWEVFRKSRLDNMFGGKINICMPGHNRTSWLIGSGLSNCPSDQVRAKVMCCKPLTTLLPDQWLLNHQYSILEPYELPPMANRWMAALGGGSYPSAEVQSAYSTAPINRAEGNGFNLQKGNKGLPIFHRADYRERFWDSVITHSDVQLIWGETAHDITQYFWCYIL